MTAGCRRQRPQYW